MDEGGAAGERGWTEGQEDRNNERHCLLGSPLLEIMEMKSKQETDLIFWGGGSEMGLGRLGRQETCRKCHSLFL